MSYNPYQHPPVQPRPPAPRRMGFAAKFVLIGGVTIAVLAASCVILALATSTSDRPGQTLGSPTRAAALGEVAPTSAAPAAKATTPARPPSTAPASPAVLTMPNVVGENAAVAEDQLSKLGFTKIQFGSQDADDKVVLLLANWTVTKQSTKAGAKVAADTLIVLTCTKS